MEDADVLISSIAYCGLICRFCFLAEKCDGCKGADNRCGRNCSEKGCYQKNCCESNKYEGCWQCAGLLSCEKGIYSSGNNKVKAFALAVREDGKEAFIENVVKNIRKGRNIGKGGDLDGKPVAAVLSVLREP